MNTYVVTDRKVKRLKRYVEKVYDDIDQNDRCIQKELKATQENKGDPIIKNEIHKTLKELSKRKAPGIDDLSNELMKNVGKNAIDRL